MAILSYCALRKKQTFKSIKEIREIIYEPYVIKITLMIFYISPIFLLNFLKILRRILIK